MESKITLLNEGCMDLMGLAMFMEVNNGNN